MPKLIFERAFHVDPITEEITSYWPERWPMKLLAKELIAVGPGFFAASYMNDPDALDGASLKESWIHLYLREDLIEARRMAGIAKGTIHVGVDLGAGGDPKNDSDYCGGSAIEMIGSQGFWVGGIHGRWPVEAQAQNVENWMDIHAPAYTIIEDTVAKGYVYGAFSATINNSLGGKGSRWPVTIEKPQGGNAVGNKTARFLSMAPRFAIGQIRLPGVLKADGTVVPSPDVEDLVQEWKSFPSGHDDTLDGLYWATFSAFRDVAAAGSTITARGRTQSDDSGGAVEICKNLAHVNLGKPVTECVRCMLTREDLQGYSDLTAPAPTTYHNRNNIGAPRGGADVQEAFRARSPQPIGASPRSRQRFNVWGRGR